MSRKLASIQRIESITPIEDADKIECLHILGWTCVGKKGEFKLGDLCVYFEVDSYLPIEPCFEFLARNSYKNTPYMGEGYRLKTQTFRGQLSQGLALPTTMFFKDNEELLVGQDVTARLGVRLYEEEARDTGMGTAIGALPGYVDKTEETRIQTEPSLIEEFKEAGPYYISTKMDGTSCTVAIRNGEVRICGHECELADDGKSPFWTLVKHADLLRKLKQLGIDNIVIQGELCGPKICRNRLQLNDYHWYVFTITDPRTDTRYALDQLLDMCDKLCLEHVPIEEREKEFPYNTVDELLERAKGDYTCGTKKEGIVIRPQTPVMSKTLNSLLSMKVLNNARLLKEK